MSLAIQPPRLRRRIINRQRHRKHIARRLMQELDPIRRRITHSREPQHAICEPQDELVGHDHALAVEGDQDAVDPVDQIGAGGKDGVEGDVCQTGVELFEIMGCARVGEVGAVVLHVDDDPLVTEKGFVCSGEEKGAFDASAIGSCSRWCFASGWKGVTEYCEEEEEKDGQFQPMLSEKETHSEAWIRFKQGIHLVLKKLRDFDEGRTQTTGKEPSNPA